ncbi:putative calcium-transporting ATPase [Rosa chinensis]|uniref:Putative calcium-transporting ATPase n=1 Tax=Rosa chinensis TaxID=74649 RepID=A0A2P6PUA8_ROSCH|nr:putative calcium-transporting ATPase [Rosa chinensis]
MEGRRSGLVHESSSSQVTGVGKFTELGRLRASADSKDTEKQKNKTHLQVLLKEVATFMGAVGFMVAAIVAYVVWIRYSTSRY